MVTSFSGGRRQSTRREPPTMGKQLVNFITCGCESSAPFIVRATSFSGVGSRSTRREPPTMGKQLVNFITWGCESSAPFLWFTKLGANPRRIGDRLVWPVRSSNLTHWVTLLNKTKWAYDLLYMTITNRNVLRPLQSKYLYFWHFLEELNASEWHFFHLIISFLLAIIVKNLNHAVELKILNFPSCFIILYISCEDSLKYVSS